MASAKIEKSSSVYPLLVCLGAMLWGTDLLLRPGLLSRGYSPALVVLLEHILLSIIFLPVLIAGRERILLALRLHWISLLAISWGGSALATWLYTQAFTFGSPLTAILLQKVQPVFAIALASIVLGERRRPLYWCVCAIAIIGAYFLAGLTGVPDLHNARLMEAIYAVGAAALWGMATVAGRLLSDTLAPSQLAATRFVLAVPPLIVFAAFSKGAGHPILTDPKALLLLVGIVAIPDCAGMLIYYMGLKGTPASTATLGELCYPITSLAIGILFLHSSLTFLQVIGLLLLLASVLWLSLDQSLVAEKPPVRSSSAAVD
jgi:drug/metabolite transporter (DMT)-like permease